MAEIKSLKEVIELAKENAELKRGIGDIFLMIVDGQRGINHRCLKNDNPLIEQIMEELSQIFDKEAP